MTHLLKNNGPAAWLLLLCMAAILAGVPAFLDPAGSSPSAGPGVMNLFSHIPAGFQRPLAGMLCLAGAVFLNITLNHIRYTPHSSFLPASLYMMMYSMLNPGGALNPSLIVNLLLTLIILKLYGLYKTKNPFSYVFDAGMLTGIAALVTPDAGLFLLYLLVSIYLFRVFNWREWAVALCGHATPVFLYGVYLFWDGRLGAFVPAVLEGFTSGDAINSLLPADYLVRGFLAVLLAVSLLFIRQQYRRSVVKTRDHHLMFIWLLLFSGVSAIFFPGTGTTLCIPAAGLVGYYLYEGKNSFLKETLFILLLLAAAARQYGEWIAG